MNHFLNKKNLEIMVIIGCGEIGANLAEKLSAHGYEIYIIDQSGKAFQRLSASYTENIEIGDATDMDIYTRPFVKNAKAIFVTTHSDNKNIFISHIIKKNSGTNAKVISFINNSDKASVYMEFGIEMISQKDLTSHFLDEVCR